MTYCTWTKVTLVHVFKVAKSNIYLKPNLANTKSNTLGQTYPHKIAHFPHRVFLMVRYSIVRKTDMQFREFKI